jgi:23S rRNA pseudouridine2605 synthase
VIDLLPMRDERLFAVGRLDMSSEGLILVTNDGELANRLTHPRYGVEKTYHVEVAGQIERADLEAMKKGVHLAEGFAHVENAQVRAKYKQSTLLEIVLKEGRNREIRRLLARQGHKALRLKRIALGPLRLGELPSGDWRPITSGELRDLRQAASGRAAPFRRKRGPRKPATPRVAQSKTAKPRLPTVIGGDAPPARPAGRPARAPSGKPANGGPRKAGSGRIGAGPRKGAASRTGGAPRKGAAPRKGFGTRKRGPQQ